MAEIAKVDASYTFVERYPSPICEAPAIDGKGEDGSGKGSSKDDKKDEKLKQKRTDGAVRELLYLIPTVAGEGKSDDETQA